MNRRNLLIVLLATSVATSLMGRFAADRLRGALSVVLAPFGDGMMYVSTALADRIDSEDRSGLTAEQARRLRARANGLQRAVELLRRQVEDARNQARLATGFRDMYQATNDLKCALIPARVVADDALVYGRSRLLAVRDAVPGSLATTNVHIVHDLRKSLPLDLVVIDGSSLVGRLSQTQAFTARLRLVSDRDFQIKARIRRRIDPNSPRHIEQFEDNQAARVLLTPGNNRPLDYLAFGDGADGMVIPNVAGNEKPLPGDLVLTYPDGAISPIEIHIGVVSRIEVNQENSQYVTVYVRPHAKLPSLRDVLVVHPLIAPMEDRN